jgi:1-deoxy-D-xylulose-5-phosphate synthase
VEENTIQGGFGSALLEFFQNKGIHNIKSKRHGLPDKFIEHGPLSLLKEKYGLDKNGIAKEAMNLCSNE